MEKVVSGASWGLDLSSAPRPPLLPSRHPEPLWSVLGLPCPACWVGLLRGPSLPGPTPLRDGEESAGASEPKQRRKSPPQPTRPVGQPHSVGTGTQTPGRLRLAFALQGWLHGGRPAPPCLLARGALGCGELGVLAGDTSLSLRPLLRPLPLPAATPYTVGPLRWAPGQPPRPSLWDTSVTGLCPDSHLVVGGGAPSLPSM